jgi:hypothetical protein
MWRDLFFDRMDLKPLSRFQAHADWLNRVGSGRHQAVILVLQPGALKQRIARLITDVSALKPTILVFQRADGTAADLNEVKIKAKELLDQVIGQRTIQGTFIGIEYLRVATAKGCVRTKLAPVSEAELRDNLARGRMVVAAPAGQRPMDSRLFTRCLARELKGLTTIF